MFICFIEWSHHYIAIYLKWETFQLISLFSAYIEQYPTIRMSKIPRVCLWANKINYLMYFDTSGAFPVKFTMFKNFMLLLQFMSRKKQMVLESKICSTVKCSYWKRVEYPTSFKNAAVSRFDQQALTTNVDGIFSLTNKSLTNLIFVCTGNFCPKIGQKYMNRVMNFIFSICGEIFSFNLSTTTNRPDIRFNVSYPLYRDRWITWLNCDWYIKFDLIIQFESSWIEIGK